MKNKMLLWVPALFLFAINANAQTTKAKAVEKPAHAIQESVAPSVQSTYSLPTDSRMVVMKYNASQIYTVLTTKDFVTHMELEEGEELKLNPAIADNIQWQVESDSNHVFIKPNVSNIRTNMTLVTNKRSYQFMLISSSDGGIYYQHIQFRYPESSIRRTKKSDTPAVEEKSEVKEDKSLSIIGDPTKNNFDYSISGSARFKPQSVQDNGKFIFIKFSDDLEELPIVFLKDSAGFNQINFTRTVKNNWITIPRMAEELVLVLDNEKIVIKKKKKGFWD